MKQRGSSGHWSAWGNRRQRSWFKRFLLDGYHRGFSPEDRRFTVDLECRARRENVGGEDYHRPTVNELQRHILDALAGPGDWRWGRGVNYLFPEIKKRVDGQLAPRDVMEALWELVGSGLVFVDYSQTAPENWKWVLTHRGHVVAKTGDEYQPDDPDSYLVRLRERIPRVDDLVMLYCEEALKAYAAACYLSSSVMLGVASERAFQILGESFGLWLSEREGEAFRKFFENPRQTYVAKFAEFRKRLEPHKPELPPGLADNLSLTLDSVLDLLRVNRNESGHPTGRRMDAGDSYINLQMFARYLERLYQLHEFFETRGDTTP